MSMITEVKCRRCGETFSALRSSCPNCGTRRVAQSGRTPGTTPGTVRGTASYERAETNTKWQMIFGLILVVAVILAVIVMVSTSLNGTDSGSGGKATAPIVTDVIPTIEAAPTPTPTPTPTLQNIKIFYGKNEQGDDANGDYSPLMHVGDEALTFTAVAYPIDLGVTNFTWRCDQEGIVQLTPSEDGSSCKVEVLQAKAGGVKIYAEAYGVEGYFKLYCVE